MKLRKRIHKLLAIVLALNLSLGLINVTAFAASTDTSGDDETYTCGKTEHTHTAECYSEPVLICGKNAGEGHTHTEECIPTTTKELTCGQEAVEGHKHTDDCYGEPVRELTCGQDEAEGHTHTDACGPVVEKELTCGQEESEGHLHSAACRTLVCTETVVYDDNGNIDTEKTQHTHNASCFETTCGLEESAGHTHTDECYTTTTTYTCGLEEVEGHTHSDECYTETKPLICGLEEAEGHEHTDECYTEVTTYSCGLEESEAHEHTSACYQLFCNLEEHPTEECPVDAEGNYLCGHTVDHKHTDDCYKNLSCKLEEHTHTEECRATKDANEPPADEAEISAVAENDLAAMIESAADGGTVDLDAEGTYTVSEAIPIKKAITINGNGSTITRDGNDDSIFDVYPGGTLTLNNVALSAEETKVKPQLSASPIGVMGELVLNGCTITGFASMHGGGLTVLSGGVATMNGGAITGNKAIGGSSAFGGGVYVEGGSFIMNGGEVSFQYMT